MNNEIEKRFFEFFKVDNYEDLRLILADKENEKNKRILENDERNHRIIFHSMFNIE
ncbi:hypothetical protein [Streptobacillus felis]|nr:hypothetical protein [Streptobacillus felis]